MNHPVVYDKAKWHFGGDFPAGLAIEQAFVHTGFYLGWVIDNDLYSEEFARECAELIRRFRAREITGPQVYEAEDGALVDDMLNTEGNSFSKAYFDFEKGSFLADYEQTLGQGLPTLYHVTDTWENYEKLRQVLDRRLRAWRRLREKRWWQFWR